MKKINMLDSVEILAIAGTGIIAGVWSYRMIKKQFFTNQEQEIDTMARTIWGEARGEGTAGMVAVGNVILNRVAAGSWYGLTVSEVCKKPKQFSCWNPDDPNYKKMLAVNTSDPQFKVALQIANNLIKYGRDEDITNGATHYHAKNIRPYWVDDMTEVATVGNHIFYA